MDIDLSSLDRPASHEAPVDWRIAHQKQIAAYNVWAEQRPTFSEIVRVWRDSAESEIPA